VIVPDRTAGLIRRGLTTTVFVIASLSFAFGFGNGWLLGLSLGVPAWIAPLVAPAVDLSVVALLAALHYLRARGLGGRLAGPRLLLAACGVITFGLNTARAVLAGQIGRACFDAIAPLLLVGWSEVGPRLLALLHQEVRDRQYERAQTERPAVVPDGSGTIPVRPEPSRTGRAAVPAPLITRARQLDAKHRAEQGRRITRDALRRELHISNTLAGAVLKHIRGPPS
jgi:hypothetical protein